MNVRRIVSKPRGSWRWQNAYAVATYSPYRTKDGRWVWKSEGQTGKMSRPQLMRCAWYKHLEEGSLHMRPISPDDLRLFALA